MYALITGASSGIGRELSLIMANNGYNLILIARREEKLFDLKKMITSKVNVIIKPYDISVLDNCEKLFDKVKQYNIKVFINNAGFGNIGYFNDTGLKTEMKMIDLNIKALQTLTKLYIQTFNNGIVVNIGSLAGCLPTPKHATYAATKAYVNSFSRAINYELKISDKNIKVLTVMPGPVKTDFNLVANAINNNGMDSTICAKKIYKGIKREKSLIIPGFTNKLIYVLIKFIPTNILLYFSNKIQKGK